MSSDSVPRVSVLAPDVPPVFIDEAVVHDVAGRAAGVIVRAPEIYLNDMLRSLRDTPRLSQPDIDSRLRKAADLFETALISGMKPEAFIKHTAQISGLPEATIQDSFHQITDAIRHATANALLGLPKGADIIPTAEQGVRGTGRSQRRGDVLTVIAPGNGPGVLGLWPQAVALGYKVLLRPSEREPFTAQRMVASMHAAGLADYAGLAPCSHKSASTLVQESDLAIVYGDDSTVKKYRDRPDVLVQGPGRSKIIVGSDHDFDDAVKVVLESVASLGGAACVCTSAVLVEGDHEEFARRLADHAEHLFKDPSFRSSAVPRQSPRTVKWFEKLLDDQTALVVRPNHEEDSEGGVRYAPLVRHVETAYHPLVQQELPVAAVTVAPFHRKKDISAIAPALVLTALTSDTSLIDRIEQLQGIRNLYVGDTPTTWMRPDVPHDGFLAEFLMTTTGYRRPSPVPA